MVCNQIHEGVATEAPSTNLQDQQNPLREVQAIAKLLIDSIQ